MKCIILFSILFSSFKCLAQSDSTEIKHSHRLWINPTQIITGQYTLAYAWNIHGGSNWYEVAIGYQYLPYPIMGYLLISPGSSPQSSPKFGEGFTGPVISFTSAEYYSKVKREMRKAAEYDPALQEMILNVKPRNSIRYVLQYQYLRHRADCYYAGEEADSYTYSSTKHCLSAEALLSRSLGYYDHHILWESYVGIGLHFAIVNETKYIDPTAPPLGNHHYCVDNIHDPNVIASSELTGYLVPMIQLGIRMGFQ